MDIIIVVLLKIFSYMGIAEAQNRLGRRYEDGDGVTKNYEKAFKLYSQSAKCEHEFAQSNLGRMYEEGLAVKQDILKAISLYKSAATQGHAWSQNKLGSLLVRGEYDVPVDQVEALKWFKKASDQGYMPGKFNIGLAYYNGNGIDKDYIKAIEYYEQVEQYIPEARYNLGLMYADGIGVDIDYEKAYKLLESAYNDGFKNAKKSMDIVKSKLVNNIWGSE